VRHEAALAELFTGVLGLCRRAGLVSVGGDRIDGTKVRANAARTANRNYEQIAREILAEAAETDRREDELYGEARSDELPEQLRTSGGRRAALREAKEELERERAMEHDADAPTEAPEAVGIELDPARFVTRAHGRRALLREGGVLEERRALAARPVPRSRAERLEESACRLEEELQVEHQANAAYEAWRRRGVAADGARRMPPGTTKPYRPPGCSSRPTPACARAPGQVGTVRPTRSCAGCSRPTRPRRSYRKPRETVECGLRPDEVQPTAGPLLTPRKIGLSVGMAAIRRQPQPAQAPQPAASPRDLTPGPGGHPFAPSDRAAGARPTRSSPFSRPPPASEVSPPRSR
jgi:hypothetical protein